MSLRPFPFVVLAVLAIVPGWTGTARLPLLGRVAVMEATRVPLDPRDPARRRLGRLTFMGGVRLTSPDPAFGGFSSLTVDGDGFTLLGDGGNVVRFRLAGDGRVGEPRFAALPAGPKTGWEKRDRDSESMAVDPATGRRWVGFERANRIWRYSPGFTRGEGSVRPPGMARWESNGGPESLVRRRDGSFIVLAETGERKRAASRPALMFAADPVASGTPAFAFRYVPPAGYDPADAAELPDGRLLVLNRAFAWPYRFASALTLVDPAAIRPGAVVRGTPVARLAAPLTHDNFEGVAAVMERGHIVVWLVSDDNRMPLQHTLLLKFRLD